MPDYKKWIKGQVNRGNLLNSAPFKTGETFLTFCLSNELNCRHVVPGFLPGFQRLVQRHLRKCFNFAGDFETSKDVSLLHPVYHIDDIRHLKMTNTKEGAAKAGLDELLDENIQRQVESE